MTAFNDTFLRACRRQPVTHIPAWYMRQAGRYQPEYREIRKTYSLVEIVEHPEVCAQVTRLPVEQLGADAAILFADIMTPLGPMGVDYEIREGIGPCIARPIRDADGVAALSLPDFAATLPHVGTTIALLRQTLPVPLIGFCGAPFTLACYLIEGGPSKNYTQVKRFMYADTRLWHTLMATLTEAMAAYLDDQAAHGAQALQIFDSWVGQLDAEDYQRYVFPHMQKLFAALHQRTDAPLIHFGVNTGHLLERLRDAGGDVIGLDWRTPVAEARIRLGPAVALQGNLDPGLLFAPDTLLLERAAAILDNAGRHGFIFNLGHGVTPHTSVDTLRNLTTFVHRHTATPEAS